MASISFISATKLADLLLSAGNQERLYVRVLSSTQLALGADPLEPTSVIDLSRERVIPFTPESGIPATAQVPPSDGQTKLRVTRRSGQYWYEIDGARHECRSLRELLSGSLRAIELKRPGTLDKLAHIKPRSKRIVALEPSALFDEPHLADKYGERLVNGWWYGTNNSAPETVAWLQRACSCGGLTWNSDFKTSLDGDQTS
ncbi:MAG: hypothetical protein ACRED5_01935 [Propylenella sp.]